MKQSIYLGIFLAIAGCVAPIPEVQESTAPYVVVLGIAQDAGYPQAGCQKQCCLSYWNGKKEKKNPVSLGIVDPISDESWLFEATPSIGEQLNQLHKHNKNGPIIPNGIFLTHAHIGHYTGLMQLGREVMGTSAVPVFTMPKMEQYLKSNGPWKQLVSLKNIQLLPLQADSAVQLNARISVTPILVPHRDEFSETVGFILSTKHKKLLFLPDINKWQVWDRSIKEYIQKVDYAFVDATFYNGEELPNRNMSEIPHPFVVKSMDLFQNLSKKDRKKVHFIHFNHTNPLLDKQSKAYRATEQNGFSIATEGEVIKM